MTLLDLPMENLLMVIEKLCMHCFYPSDIPEHGSWAAVHAIRQEALVALSLTSRFLNVLVTPHFYHEPTGNWSLLMRTLIERPDLALHVKSLQIGEGWPDFESLEKITDGNIIVNALNAAIEDRAEGAFGEMYEEDPDMDEWDKDARDSVNLVDFFVSLCPNLSRLDVALNQMGPNFSMVGRRGLKELKDVTLSYMNTQYGWPMSLICRLPIVAPKLSSLHCRSIDGPTDFDAKFKNLTKLELYICSIETGFLEPILRAMPRLEYLSFVAGDASVSFEPHLSMREMQDVLTLHAPGLKTLVVDLQIGNPQSVVESRDLWTSLSGLTKLEHLNFDYRCIFPHHEQQRITIVNGQPAVLPTPAPGKNLFVDLLPRSIQTVRFAHGPIVGGGGSHGPSYSESVDVLFPALEYLSSVAAEKFPSLRWFEITNAYRLRGDMDAIKSVMEAGGIQFMAAVQPNVGYMPCADELTWTARYIPGLISSEGTQ